MTESNVLSIQGEQITRLLAEEGIPKFEGEDVVATKARISSVAGLEVGDNVYRLDETVRVVVECLVVGVDHKVNTNGKLERVHHFKAVDSVVINWQLDLGTLREATP